MKRIGAKNVLLWAIPLLLALRAASATVSGSTAGDAPWLSMAPARTLTASTERARAFVSLASGGLAPVALAAGDFDEDGAPDLLTGYATSRGGLVTIQLGDPAGLGPAGAKARRGWPPGKLPFRGSLYEIITSEVPGWILVGDFNADSHLDIAVAVRGGSRIEVHLGDGKGGFAPASFIALPGQLKALESGDVNRRDGLPDLVAGVDGPQGPALLVYESPEGALRAEPERFALRAPVSALALGRFSDGPSTDIVASAGAEIMVIWGRDRLLSYGEEVRKGAPGALVTTVPLPIETLDLAVGNYHWDAAHCLEVAALGADGRIRMLSPARASGSATPEVSSFGPWQSRADIALPEKASRLRAVRSTSLPVDGVIVLPDASGSPVRFIAGDIQDRTDDVPEVRRPKRELTLSPRAVETDFKVVAALPMRLNEDALEDWILAGVNPNGHAETVAILTQPLATYTVTNTNDSGSGSFRQAIINANASSGSDAIHFAIPGSSVPTIVPLTGLPKITSVVTIQGGTQAAGYVRIWGGSAGSSANGLAVAGGNSVIEGLVIQFFQGLAILLETNGGDQVANCSIVNCKNGISIAATSSGDTIGGIGAAYRNEITDNTYEGIIVNASSTIIEGNLIGNDGTNAFPNGFFGIDVAGGSNVQIGGTNSFARNLLSGNTYGGVLLEGGSGALVQGNWIGRNFAGTGTIGGGTTGVSVATGAGTVTIGGTSTGAGNVISSCSYGIDVNAAGSVTIQGNWSQGNTLDGIRVNATASPLIGGSASGAGNVISGNDSYGIEITGGSATISGNIIGLNSYGTQASGNKLAGIEITAGSGTVIGGYTDNERNTISGNGGYSGASAPGIDIKVHASNVGIYGNYIGTDTAGTGRSTYGSNSYGIYSASSSGLHIGSATAGGGNLISGNSSDGIYLTGTPATEPVVVGNIIGLDAAGTAALFNVGSGIHIVDAQNIAIGGASRGTGNVISGNLENGVMIESVSTSAAGTILLGNKIGTDATGALALGNGGAGVKVTGASASNNTIGLPPSGNIIANNSGPGVWINSGIRNTIRGNSMHDNGGGSAAKLGIQLGGGLYANTHCGGASGANNLQNYPVVTSVAPSESGSLISGTLDSPAMTAFTVDLYSNQAIHASGYGEGKTWLGSVSVTTNLVCATGWSFTSSTPATNVSATATDPNGNTSEFSLALITGSPTEAGPAVTPLTASKGSGTAVTIAYGSACNATQYAAYWGTSPIAGAVSWQSSACNVTNSFDPGAVAAGKFIYFVVVGQSASYEGSYGKNSNGTELPAKAGGCHPQSLTGLCP